jgi:hypothetical protein
MRLQLLQHRSERVQWITVGIDRLLHEQQQRGVLFVGQVQVLQRQDMGSRRGGRYPIGFWDGS